MASGGQERSDPGMGSELDFRPVPAGTGDGAVLVAAMIDEMRELYWDIGDGLDLDSPAMPKAGPFFGQKRL